MSEERQRALLVEYTAAQNSAQHHDSLVWTTVGLVLSAELILLGFVIQNFNNPQVSWIIILASALALILLVFLLITYSYLRSVRNQKYRRCKELEEELNLQQHRKLVYKERVGKKSLITVLCSFICIWFFIILYLLIKIV